MTQRAPVHPNPRSPAGGLYLSLVLGVLLACAPSSPAMADVNWLRTSAPQAVPRREPAPHPAVARIIVPERGGTAYGSGTLVDVRDQYGLVITNWHVVRDAAGEIEVVFPGGFRSFARALKLDRNWDLAALVIWRPELEPVPIADQAPRPGDVLTIAGHGQGRFRAVTGRCTQYLAPGTNFPFEMIEVSVEARQGDSGGPILNDQGQLAGVLFGAGHGTTTGSYAGRVRGFLASVAPDLADPSAARIVAQTERPVENDARPDPIAPVGRGPGKLADVPPQAPAGNSRPRGAAPGGIFVELVENPPPRRAVLPEHPPQEPMADGSVAAIVADSPRQDLSLTWRDLAGATTLEQAKTVLAGIGLVTVLFCVLRLGRTD